MPTITLKPHPEMCPEGTAFEATPGMSICDALLANGVHIEHACEKSCACTTCHVHVREGGQALDEADELEEDYLDKAWGLGSGFAAVLPGDRGRYRSGDRDSEVHHQHGLGGPALMDMDWADSREIAIELSEAHPEVDPQYVRFTDLHAWIMALEDFKGDPEKSSEGILEGIQMMWMDEVD